MRLPPSMPPTRPASPPPPAQYPLPHLWILTDFVSHTGCASRCLPLPTEHAVSVLSHSPTASHCLTLTMLHTASASQCLTLSRLSASSQPKQRGKHQCREPSRMPSSTCMTLMAVARWTWRNCSRWLPHSNRSTATRSTKTRSPKCGMRMAMARSSVCG